MTFGHQTVLLQEAVSALMTTASGTYVDGTFGRGGHSARVLAALAPEGRLIAFDKDPQAAAWASDLSSKDPRLTFVADGFGALSNHCGPKLLSGILLDLGVSSPQLDDAERGFSFSHDGPLDMRMDTRAGVTAADWVNDAAESEMVQVFRDYGEERFAKRIARAIIERRQSQPFSRTGDLAAVVSAANPRWEKHKHPATRVFQAIRIYINRELDELRQVLAASLSCLMPGGRLVVISFHSLEDRIVKRFMRDQSRGIELPRGVPVTDSERGQTLKLLGKAQKPSAEEIAVNPRARSAVMRVAERLP